jgi:hypothetical protein
VSAIAYFYLSCNKKAVSYHIGSLRVLVMELTFTY